MRALWTTARPHQFPSSVERGSFVSFVERFEFRAVGSAQIVAFPLIVFNTAATEDMSMLCNTIVVSFFYVSVFRVKFLFADAELCQGLWQL